MKCKKCGNEVVYNWGDKKNPICHLCGRTLTEKEWENIVDRLVVIDTNAFPNVDLCWERKYIKQPSRINKENTCVCCGEVVPEGRQICKNCEVQT
jgi:RNA polymerase subunit RPABC4/transcription elongation factor Spt4